MLGLTAALWALEQGWLPDGIIRFGIRQLLKKKLQEETQLQKIHGESYLARLMPIFTSGPIAVCTQEANKQHYELPPEFFTRVLGRNMKYSCALWNKECCDLDEAEEAMLDLTLERADILDGQDILEMGCGWGSLTLTMARRFPKARIVAVSNSKPQRLYIEQKLRNEGLTNVQIITQDINHFYTDRCFDRIVSVEMFEHMRNYDLLFKRLHGWLKRNGKLFVHIFAHSRFCYLYDNNHEKDWIGRYFFSGGVMPRMDLFDVFAKGFVKEAQWFINGRHYQKTAEEWLLRFDRNRPVIEEIFKEVYGAQARVWIRYWRVFFMACAEMWGYKKGKEWGVTHIRWRRVAS